MIKIKNKIISNQHKPFIIAEISGNHDQSISKVFKIIDQAKKAGVDAIKLQTYKPETITLNVKRKEFLITDKKNIWKGNTLHNLYKKAQTPWEWHKRIFDYAKKKKILCFSSPFDETAVDFLEKLNVCCYKIASFENNHYPLIKKVIQTGKPLFISLGLANYSEILSLVKFFKKNKFNKYILLKCTSIYPADPKLANLKTLQDLKKKFNCEVGLSDHTLGIGTSLASICFGGSVIEKHIKLFKNDKSIDSKFSLTPDEFNILKNESIRVWESIGKVNYKLSKIEKNKCKFKRSIYISSDIKKNDLITEKNVKVIRPGYGLQPKFYYKIIGRKAKKNLYKGMPLKFSSLK